MEPEGGRKRKTLQATVTAGHLKRVGSNPNPTTKEGDTVTRGCYLYRFYIYIYVYIRFVSFRFVPSGSNDLDKKAAV